MLFCCGVASFIIYFVNIRTNYSSPLYNLMEHILTAYTSKIGLPEQSHKQPLHLSRANPTYLEFLSFHVSIEKEFERERRREIQAYHIFMFEIL